MIQKMPMQQPGMVVGGETSFVAAEQLKQVDTPIETVLGVANGAVTGALMSSGISALASTAEIGRFQTPYVVQNIRGNHLGAILAGTAVFAALGGLTRYARARKHNEWSERHYAFLEQQEKGGHADRVEASRDQPALKGL